MSLDKVPAGISVLIDTNIIVYARQQLSAECINFLRRCSRWASGLFQEILTRAGSDL